MTSATLHRPHAATTRTTTPPAEPAAGTLRALSRHYERHVLAWYALGRVQEARATWAAVWHLRGCLADAKPAATPATPALDAHPWRS